MLVLGIKGVGVVGSKGRKLLEVLGNLCAEERALRDHSNVLVVQLDGLWPERLEHNLSPMSVFISTTNHKHTLLLHNLV